MNRDIPAHQPALTRPLPGPGNHEAETGGAPGAGGATPSPTPSPASLAPAQSVSTPFSITKLLKNTEFWLNKVGIVLFLFGVAFLFKYALDHRWLSEEMRVGIGALLGSVLLGLGLWLHKERRHFSQVLLGGAIATYYITGYAAYVVFPNLGVPYDIAFGAMALVTALAFALSLWGDDLSLSLIGVTGAMLIPFVLNNWAVDPLFLSGYARVVLAGMGAIYLFRGWRSLLWASFVGGWAIVTVAAWGSTFGRDITLMKQTDLQVTLLVMMAVFWAAPVLHEVLWRRNPLRFRKPAIAFINDPQLRHVLDAHLYVLPVLVPIFTLSLSELVWGSVVPYTKWDMAAFGLAGLYVLTAKLVREYNTRLAYTHTLMSIVLLNLGLLLVLGDTGFLWGNGNALYLGLAVEAAVLHFMAARFSDRGLSVMGHIVSGVVGLWLLERVMHDTSYFPAIINPYALADLLVMGLIFAASFVQRPPLVGYAYRLLVHIAALAWLWREFSHLQNPLDYLLLGAALYATLLHLATLRAWRTGDGPMTQMATQLVIGAVGVGLLTKIVLGLILRNADALAVLNNKGLADLGVIALIALVGWTLRRDHVYAPAYGLWLHFAFLGWTWQEVGLLQSGNGFVTIVWGAYALLLIGVAIYMIRKPRLAQSEQPAFSTPQAIILLLGLTTLFGVAGKLFLVDLHDLDAIWRILLFLGFGGLFLLVSYYLQGLVKQAES